MHTPLVFRAMLTLPQPGTNTPTSDRDTARPPSIDLPEDSTTLEILLRMIYPVSQPSIDTISTLANAFFAAEKYDMAGVISTLRLHLRDERFLNDSPMHVFAIACHFQFVAEAKAASRASLMISIHDPKNLEIFEQSGFKVADLISLHALRHKRIDGMRAFLDGERFEGVRRLTFFLSVYNNSNNITIKLITTIIVPAFKYHNADLKINPYLPTRTPPTSPASHAQRPSKTQHGPSSKPAS